MTAQRVLVVGTYPPIPLPSAAAAVDAVRSAWSDGFEVTIVSPRLSAADFTVAVSGPLAALRLDRMRKRVAADRLVLVVEPGFPLLPGPAALQWITAATMARVMRRFAYVRVVIVGDLGRSQRWAAPLRAAAQQVSVLPGGQAPPGVTPSGPAEVTGTDVPAELVAKLGRRLLGRHAAPVRAQLGRLRRRVRSGVGSLKGF